MNAQTNQACFRISGEWVTEFARTRVIEKRWDSAVRVLECMEGITLDQIMQILRGDAKLTGDSSDPEGIGFEPDDATAHKVALLYSFGGVWNNAGRFMRPYAVVTSWGRDDMIPAVSGRRSHQHSSLYYADAPDKDVCVTLDYPNDVFDRAEVLWEDVPNFPHLIVDAAPLDGAQEALDRFRANGGRLEERGYLGGRWHANEVDDLIANGEVVIDPAKVQKEIADPEPVEAPSAGFFTKLFPTFTDEDVERYRAQIREQAGDDVIEMTYQPNSDKYEPTDETVTLRIPRAPFENWCLWRGDGAHLAAPWKTIAPSGLKMMGDDPYHTDFMLGAGLDPDDMRDHDSPLSRAIWDLRREVQAEKLGFKCAVLCGTGVSPTLKVVHPKRNEECKPDEVAVIPNAGPSYVAAAMTAGAIITEQGGAMAHLVTISREKDLKIVRVEGARKIYPVGMRLVVDCAKGDVHVPANRVDHKMKMMGLVVDLTEQEEED